MTVVVAAVDELTVGERGDMVVSDSYASSVVVCSEETFDMRGVGAGIERLFRMKE